MILYHGSSVVVKTPKILTSNRGLDFGVGFYCTTFKKQAQLWAHNKANFRTFMNNIKIEPILNIYEIDELEMSKVCRVKKFEVANADWLDFVCKNRKNNNKLLHSYDIVIGEVADDTVFTTIDLYMSNYISRKEALRRIKFKKKNNQVSFHSLKSIKLLNFKKAIKC